MTRNRRVLVFFLAIRAGCIPVEVCGYPPDFGGFIMGRLEHLVWGWRFMAELLDDCDDDVWRRVPVGTSSVMFESTALLIPWSARE
jgi:hypothetical protein